MAVEIAIAAKPTSKPMSGDVPMDDPVAQDIADAAKALPVDDLTKLMQGITPEALEVMEKIPQLAAFADFIENGGDNAQDDPNAPTAAPASDVRSQIAGAMRQNGMRA